MLAKSDSSNMLKLDMMENLLEKLVKIRRVILDFEK
jgi:3-deoxy-D-manno-octulosonic acid (KDO) 8-phosphate synthase